MSPLLATGSEADDDGLKLGGQVFELLRPKEQQSPVIFASPHSGRRYPSEFLALSRLDRHALRQSEDGYVDMLFDAAPRFGAPLIRALFPRAYVDVNRARDEVDPRMFVEQTPPNLDSKSNRVRVGLGVIPRIVADGQDIYSRKLKYRDANKRLEMCYDPYHKALSDLIEETKTMFGCAVLIDCHSMPSVCGSPFRAGDPSIDFVLGDRYGVSCSGSLTCMVEQAFAAMGYRVSRNSPYAGGHVAAFYGRPEAGVHVLQIEINRGLYLDETRLTRHHGFSKLRASMEELIGSLVKISPISLNPALAAE